MDNCTSLVLDSTYLDTIVLRKVILMKVTQSFIHPLTQFEQPVDKSLYLHSFITDYINRHQLFGDVERYTKIIGLFMRLCCPSNVSYKGLDAVCMFTTLSFLIDDQADKDDIRYLEQYREIVKGVRTPASQLEDALSELLDLVDDLSSRTQTNSDLFRQLFLDYIAAQQWERTYLNRSQGGFRLEDYLRYRPDAIALFPYLALLKLSEEIDELQGHSLQKAQLLFLEQLAARIAYLDNDICSWEFERSDPTALNLVKILKEEWTLSWNASLEEVMRTRDATVKLYVCNRDYALQVSDDASLKRYLTFIECSITGNFETLRRLKLQRLRYEATESLAA